MDLRQLANGIMTVHSPVEGFGVAHFGGPANPATGCTSSSTSTNNLSAGHKVRASDKYVVPLFAGTAQVTGSLGVWVNPYNETLLITDVEVLFTIGGTQSFSLSVGVVTLSVNLTSGLILPASTPLGNNLIDAANYAGADATTVINNRDNNGSAGKRAQLCTPGQAIVVTQTTAGAQATHRLSLMFTATKV